MGSKKVFVYELKLRNMKLSQSKKMPYLARPQVPSLRMDWIENVSPLVRRC